MKIQSADIFIDIVDNYGDMGWVLEFLLMSRFPHFWRIVTDHPLKMRTFLSQSGSGLTGYEIQDKEDYDFHTSSALIILGLHADIDFSRIPAGRNVIRVNYLTYDHWYEKIHDTEHILSSQERPIREIVYSPLPGLGGLWKYEPTDVSRDSWLEKVHLPNHLKEKLWIPLFCYAETLKNFDRENISEDSIIFLIGNTLTLKSNNENIIILPWMKRDDLWHLIDLADISILRGEISSVRGLRSRKPYIWDMYKDLGGWNHDESEGFLSYISADKSYRSLHESINGGKRWNLQNIVDIYQNHPFSIHHEIPDFRETLQKTIDSFGISL